MRILVGFPNIARLMSKKPDKLHKDTIAARFAVDTDEQHGAVIPPLYMSSNFSFEGFDQKREYDYTTAYPAAGREGIVVKL